jgi:hypothetical protein
MQREWLRPITERLKTMSVELAKKFLARIPPDWGLSGQDSDAVAEFLYRRARHVSDKLDNMVWEDDTIWSAAREA